MLVLLTVLAATSSAAQESSIPPLPDGRFALALYCNPTCDDSVLDSLDTALASIESADEFSDRVARPQRIMGIGGVDFGIPDADFVTAYGIDVDRPEALAQSQMVLLAWFASPRERSVETFALAHQAFSRAAQASGGWVEDLDTQMLFGAAAFAERDPRGDTSAWFVIDDEPMSGEAGSEGASAELRLFTRGLRRYGDFELVAESVSPEAASDVSWVLSAVATTLHPLPDISPTVKVSTDSAVGTANLTPLPATEADPTTLALKVSFQGDLTVPVDVDEAAAELEQNVERAAIAPITPNDPPPPVPSNAPPQSLAEAQARVVEALANAVYPAFVSGLAPGEVLAVNVPFRDQFSGSEYLWIEVTSWSGATLTGRLATQPANVLGLTAGQVVSVQQSDVFDYVWKRADGTKSGNWTKPFRR